MGQAPANAQAGAQPGAPNAAQPMMPGSMTAERHDRMQGRGAMQHASRHRHNAHYRHYAHYWGHGRSPHRWARYGHGGWSPDDAMTVELNRQELARITGGTGVPQYYGSSVPPAPPPPPSAGYEPPPPGFPQPFPRF
jgi:hypothetical protein